MFEQNILKNKLRMGLFLLHWIRQLFACADSITHFVSCGRVHLSGCSAQVTRCAN